MFDDEDYSVISLTLHFEIMLLMQSVEVEKKQILCLLFMPYSIINHKRTLRNSMIFRLIERDWHLKIKISESIIPTEYAEFIETRTAEIGRTGILSFVIKLF